MEEKRNVPKIRFPGFTEDWEQRKVKELCSISTGKSNTQDKVDDGEYPFYVRSPIIERSTKYLYDEEAVLTVGDGVGTGKVFHYVNGKYDLHQRCYRMYDFTKELNARYFYHIFSLLFYNRVMAMTAKTSVDSVRMEMIADMEIPVPNIEEQKEIGSFLTNLDNLITLHQRKCDETKKLKKYMLQKMFPKNGEQFPKIRFEGFTDAWEQRKLGDVVEEFYNGQTPYRQNKSYWDGNISWLSSGDLNRGIVTSTMEKITEEGRNASRLRIVPKGTFVMAVMGLEAAGTRGNCGILGIDTTINQACMALIVDEKRLSSSFLFQWYRCFGDYYALKYCQGTKQQNYNAELLSDLDIDYPSIEEQAVISQYFENLDNLITLHRRKCDELKKLKKYMLQNMFI